MIRFNRTSLVTLTLLAGALVAGCERPPVQVVQRGFRGTGMDEVYNPRTLAKQASLNEVPAAPAPASPDGPKAGTVYQNVKILGDLSVGEFARSMVSITSWVAPTQGCTYCHSATNFADDSKYTKVVARRMLQMTQHINSEWKTHVAATGVTCYTCHRGNAVPTQVWYQGPGADNPSGYAGNKAGQNAPVQQVGMTSLPNDPFTPFLLQSENIRVTGPTALKSDNKHSIKQTEWTYGLMVHMSESLGVNCTYCHNSRSFQSWDLSTPQRATAWYGIRMARDVNGAYLTSLTDVFPANRKGPLGDVAKVSCATCHQGAFKPLYGVSMLKDHMELAGGVKVVAAGAAMAGGGAMVYFAVGSAVLTDDAQKFLATVVDGLKANPDAHATISGFHSASGDLASNQELAKQRAFAVRDALKAAGIAPERVELEKPMSAEANLSGEDPMARRVEVALK